MRINGETTFSELTHSDEELEHAWLKKGEEAEDHKYVARVKVNNGNKKQQYRYFYTWKEYSAYLKSKSHDETPKKKTVLDSVKDALGLNKRIEYKTAEERYQNSERSYQVRKRMYNDYRERAYEDNYINDSEKVDIETSRNRYNAAYFENVDAGREFANSQEEYFKTPIGAIESVYNKFVDLVTDYLKDADERWADKMEIRNREKETKRESDLNNRTSDVEKATEERNEHVKKEDKERTDGRKSLFQRMLDELKKHNPLPSLNIKSDYDTYEEDMLLVNPNYNPDTYGKSDADLYDQNCAVCTIAYDLRRRGYDVEAKSEMATVNDGSGTKGMTINDIAKCYSNTTSDGKFITYSEMIVGKNEITEKYKSDGTVAADLKNLETELLSYGDGARGNFAVYWILGGGHSVSWEVANNKVVIRDCQTQKTYQLGDYSERIKDFNIIRTDNLTPDETILQYVKNREER